MKRVLDVLRRTVLLAVLLVLGIPVWASVYRFTFVSPSGPPPFPLPQYLIVDLAAQLPTTAVREGDLAYARDDDTLYKRTAAAWASVAGAAGAPTDAEYVVGALHADLSAERLATNTATITWDMGTAGQAKANVPDDAITFAKLQNITDARLLGRSAGSSGDMQEITVGAGLSLSAGALTVPDDGITYAKIQNVSATSRFLGRITGGAGDVEELTGTQATTLLDAFTDALKGVAPASGGGTSNFLRADGTWAVPPGGSGAPTDAEYWVDAEHAGLSAEKVLGTAVGTIDGLCIGIAACTPTADEIQLGDANFKLAFNAGDPQVVFDSTDFVRYTRASNFWEWLIASTQEMKLSVSGLEISNGLLVGFNGVPGDDEVQVGDSNFRLDLDAGGAGRPALVFDAGDAHVFDRTTNTHEFIIGNAVEAAVNSSGLTIASFNGGTGASGTTFWRGDGTWATPAGGGGGPVAKWMSSTTSNDTTTFADISTELNMAVLADTTYAWTCELAYDSAGTTIAIHLSMNGPASPTLLQYTVWVATSDTASHSSSQILYDTVTNPGTSGGSLDLPARITGVIQIGVTGGTLAPRFKSEGGGTITVKQGSQCTLFET